MSVGRRLCALLVGCVALVGLWGAGSGTVHAASAASDESCVDNMSGELCLSISYTTATHLTRVRATEYYGWSDHCMEDSKYMTFELTGTRDDGTPFTKTAGPYDSATRCYDSPFLDHEYVDFVSPSLGSSMPWLDVKPKSRLCVRATYNSYDGTQACFVFP